MMMMMMVIVILIKIKTNDKCSSENSKTTVVINIYNLKIGSQLNQTSDDII